mmetsp:Transcript_64358/g.199304  ORF Transcript_64358/g.199304 Transcript_64358/m.199304 type:complete len:80 (-) Transcript_64358:87-326(-)
MDCAAALTQNMVTASQAATALLEAVPAFPEDVVLDELHDKPSEEAPPFPGRDGAHVTAIVSAAHGKGRPSVSYMSRSVL